MPGAGRICAAALMNTDPNTMQAQGTLLPLHYIHTIGTLLTVKCLCDPLGVEVRDAPETDILKVIFFLRSQNFSFVILRKKTCKNYT